MVYGRDVVDTDDLLLRDVTEHGDLLFRCGLERLTNGKTACDEVRKETQSAQSMDGGLRWLRLLLTVHVGDKRNVNESEVFVADAELELTHGLDKGCGLDVTHSPAKLGSV